MVAHDRYSRHVRFSGLGQTGQQALSQGRVAIIGCGALGTAVAEQLVRAGVAFCRIIDRDFVDWSNLQRQCLFVEDDAEAARPKAVAAAQRLSAVNSTVTVEPHVLHIDASNIRDLIADVDVVMDGCDNFATRHVVNDACCALKKPWVYGACVGAYACSMPVLPGETACLRCLQDELPDAGDGPTCDSAGIIAPAVHLAASMQVAEALKILAGKWDAVRRALWTCDLWGNNRQQMDTVVWRDPQCRSCGASADYPALQVSEQVDMVLCGRDAVQFARGQKPDLEKLAQHLHEQVLTANAYLVRWQDGDLVGTVFKDGRVMVQGTNDGAIARACADRVLG